MSGGRRRRRDPVVRLLRIMHWCRAEKKIGDCGAIHERMFRDMAARGESETHEKRKQCQRVVHAWKNGILRLRVASRL